MVIGVSEEHFWDSTPNELQPYVKADEMRQERMDAQMWQMGIYVADAVYTSVMKALNGKKARAKYMQEPLMQAAKKEEEERNPETDFALFMDWATVYNSRFKDGQA